jgi:phosphatidylserine/phosphatidylglycerophosphate/cardiolipin synthase-like enzyme
MSDKPAATKIALSTRELQELVRAIERTLVRAPLDEEALAGAGLAHLVPRLGRLGGLPPELARSFALALVDERSQNACPQVQLVWTGPETISSTARDTATVVRELFSRARKSVLVAGYAFDHGADILEPLYQAMKAHGVDTRMFVDIPRGDGKESASSLVAQWKASFFLENWLFPLRPTIYFDPRAVSREGYSSLHAKCIVIDDRYALVTSANFTDRGQDRNIEVGVVIEDPFFGRSLVEQWVAAVTAGVFLDVEGFARKDEETHEEDNA